MALILSCVAITMSAINKPTSGHSGDKNDEEIKRLDVAITRLDEYQNRLQKLEQQLNIQDNIENSEISEIRPAHVFQISVHTTYPAQLAIDGSADTYMHTNKETNPWWCADLQNIYHIKRVVVTNIKGSSNNVHYIARSTNLRIGVTNTTPVVGENLAFDAYTLCEYKPGYMGAVGNVTCPDGVSGQYVIVQFGVHNYMTIAEVNIYGYKDQL